MFVLFQNKLDAKHLKYANWPANNEKESNISWGGQNHLKEKVKP